MQTRGQTLDVVARLWADLLNGEKRSTIRWSEPEIKPGRLRFLCDGQPHVSLDVEVWRVTKLPLSEAARFLGREADWPDQIMLEGMKEHYPNIQLIDIVQIVEFRPLSRPDAASDRR